MLMNARTTISVAACVLLVWNPTVFGRDRTRPFKLVPRSAVVESGVFDGTGTADGTHEPVFTEMISAEDTPWMRVHFSDYDLGTGSFIILTSLFDGDWQRLDSTTLPIWSDTSGVFNGADVELALYVAPEDTGVFINVDRILVADPADLGDDFATAVPRPDGGIATICGETDNRVLSDDSRVGRLFFGGCTGWLVSNGAALTAGHCGDPDGDLSGIVLEFNVPPSSANGAPNAAALNDQYPITQWNFQSNGEGQDYSVFRLGRNSNTLLSAHRAQGFFHMTGVTPAVGATLRVTGYGIDPYPSGPGGAGAPCCDWDDDDSCNYDCNADSFMQQTSLGSCDDCLVGSAIEHTVDTMPANSGSPIIWEQYGLAIGIHTQGGCDTIWSDYDNAGTWLGYGLLQQALQSYLGDALFVDSAFSASVQTGTVLYPFSTVAAAANIVPDGGSLAIVAGWYTASVGNVVTLGADGRAMTLTAPVGTVLIGN